MKICVAQTRPVKGDIKTNIDLHKRLIELASPHGAGFIIFPELSLTGYEPTLAKELATEVNDSRFDDFQVISDTKNIIIGAGMPIKNNGSVSIGMLLFQPHKERQVYFKKYLHADEDPYFITGESLQGLPINGTYIGLAICYELSVPQHAENAFNNGANIYIASVAKTIKGTDKAIARLSEIAKKYDMEVLMSNCIGICDGEEMGGSSSAWNENGESKGQLDDSNEGILIFDTVTQEVIKESNIFSFI